MERSVFEKVNYLDGSSYKCFATSFESSCYHWHHDYEIISMLKGGVQVHISGKTFSMQAGDILLLNSDEIHSIFNCEKDNLAIVLQFNGQLLKDVLETRNRSFYFYLNSCDDTAAVKKEYSYFIALVAQIWMLTRTDEQGVQFQKLAGLFNLLAGLMQYCTYDIIAYNEHLGKSHLDLERLAGYIEDNYSKSIEIDDIARHMGMSRSTLYRFLKQTLGISLSEMIRYYRIEHAKNLLKQTEYSIAHVSALCGFSNDMSFYRAFKSETHTTPSDFRETGMKMVQNFNIQGYLGYNQDEAYQLAQRYLESNKHDK